MPQQLKVYRIPQPTPDYVQALKPVLDVVDVGVRTHACTVADHRAPAITANPSPLCGDIRRLTNPALRMPNCPGASASMFIDLLYFWAFSASLQAAPTPDLGPGQSFPSVFYFTYFTYHVGAIVAACLPVFGCRLYPRDDAIAAGLRRHALLGRPGRARRRDHRRQLHVPAPQAGTPLAAERDGSVAVVRRRERRASAAHVSWLCEPCWTPRVGGTSATGSREHARVSAGHMSRHEVPPPLTVLATDKFTGQPIAVCRRRQVQSRGWEAERRSPRGRVRP